MNHLPAFKKDSALVLSHNMHLKAELKPDRHNSFEVIESNSSLIQVIDLKTEKIIYSNMRFEEALGYSSDDLTEWTVKELKAFIHPDDIERVRAHRTFFFTAIGDEEHEVTSRALTKNGEWKWFKATGKVFKRDASGMPLQYISIAYEIPSQSSPEETVEQNRRFMQAIIHAVPGGLHVFRPVTNESGEIVDFKCMFVNENSQEQFGQNLVGSLMRKTFPGGDDNFIFEKYVLLSKTGLPIQFEYSFSIHGTEKWFSISGAKADSMIVLCTVNVTERKRTEIQIQKVKELLQSIFDASTMGICVLKSIYNLQNEIIDFEFSFINTVAEAFIKRNVTAKRFLQEFPMAAINGIFKAYKETAETGRSSDFEHYYSGDGLKEWLRHRVVKTNEGTVVTMENISKRKQAEKELKQREKEWSTLVSNTPDLITRWDRNLKLVYANTAFESKTGMQLSELIRKSLIEFKEDETPALPDLSHIQRAFEYVIAQDHFSYDTSNDDDVVYFHYRIIPELDTNSIVQTVLCIARDITELKRNEEQLKENKYFIERLTLTSPDKIFVMNINTREVVYANRSCAEMLGYTQEQIADMNNVILDVIHPDDLPKVLTAIDYMHGAADGEILETEYRVIDASGAIRWMSDRNAVFKRDDWDRVLEKIGVTHEITEQKKLQKEAMSLKLSQQKQTLNAILHAQEEERERIGEALHNGVGQLLYAIKLRCELFNEQYPQDKSAFQEIDHLLEEAIYDTSRISFELIPSILKGFGLEAALKELISRTVKNDLLVSLNVSGFEQHADNENLELTIFRIVQELLNNIIKHARAKRAGIDIFTNLDRIHITVQDDGLGFDESNVDAMHKGIGLQSIKNRVRLLNGKMNVRSSESMGACFSIDLPNPNHSTD